MEVKRLEVREREIRLLHDVESFRGTTKGEGGG